MTNETCNFLSLVRDKKYNTARGFIEDNTSISFSDKDDKNNNVIHTIVLKCSDLSPDSACSKLICAIAKRQKSLLDEKNNEGNTPAHIATKLHNNDLVELLKSCGANLSIPNNDGKRVVGKSLEVSQTSQAPQTQVSRLNESKDVGLLDDLSTIGMGAFNEVSKSINEFMTEAPARKEDLRKKAQSLVASAQQSAKNISQSSDSESDIDIEEFQRKLKLTVDTASQKSQPFIDTAKATVSKGAVDVESFIKKGQPKAQELFEQGSETLQSFVKQNKPRATQALDETKSLLKKGESEAHKVFGQVVDTAKQKVGELKGGSTTNESTEFLKRLRSLMDSETQAGGSYEAPTKSKSTGWRKLHYTLDSVNEAELFMERSFDPEAEKLHNEATQKLTDLGVSDDDVRLYKAIFWQKAKKDAEKLKEQGQRVDNLQKSQMLVDLVTKEAVKKITTKELNEMKKIFEQRAKEKEARGDSDTRQDTDKPKRSPKKSPKKSKKTKKSKKSGNDSD